MYLDKCFIDAFIRFIYIVFGSIITCFYYDYYLKSIFLSDLGVTINTRCGASGAFQVGGAALMLSSCAPPRRRTALLITALP